MVSRGEIKRELGDVSQHSDGIFPTSVEDVSCHNNSAQLSGYGTIKFIETVQERPEVWDSRSNAYKLKDVKQHAWKCIAAKMDPEFHSLSQTEQNVAVHGWMRRWKSLRDCYTREDSRNNPKKKKYIYFDYLDFLNEVVSSKREGYRRMKDYNDETKEQTYMPEDLYSGDLWSGKQFLVVEQDETPQEILSFQQLAALHQAQLQEAEEEPQPVAVFSIADDDDDDEVCEVKPDDSTADDSSSTDKNHPEDDPDRMFLLSLIPDMRKIPPASKLHVKTKILEIIQDAIADSRGNDN